jgi:hypothetical protein
VRLFFHEFYRLREIFSTITSVAEKRGFITKEERADSRQVFHESIDQIIELRNTMVHGTALWSGQEHFDLNLIALAHKRGQRVVDDKTGREFSVEMALEKACTKSADTLQMYGQLISELMNLFVRGVVTVTAKKH